MRPPSLKDWYIITAGLFKRGRPDSNAGFVRRLSSQSSSSYASIETVDVCPALTEFTIQQPHSSLPRLPALDSH